MIRTSKYSANQTDMWRGEIMVTLSENKRAMTIPEIMTQNVDMAGASSQKIATILANLYDMGVIEKFKSKMRGGKMVYGLKEYMDVL